MIYTGARRSRKLVPAGEQGIQGDLRGRMAPDFELNTLDGKKVKLSDLRGKAVVVNFWATWCGPCKIEMPWLTELQDKYRAQGLEILGISVDEGSSDKIAAFTKEMGVSYTVLRATDVVSDSYGGVDGLPTTFYVGRDGKVVDQGQGIVSKDVMENAIRLALVTGQKTSSIPTVPANVQEATKK